MFENVKRLCDSFLDAGMPGFDLAVLKNGECVLRYMNGYSDLEKQIKINGKERYNIYSCSKPITCVSAMQLWEKKMFSLDDELSRYMPEFADMTVMTENGVKKAEKPILIKHLFEMTAGFSYNCYSPKLMELREKTDGRCPLREVARSLAKEPLLFEPGERWEYSLCHDVLAALVEVISGEKFESYVKKHIFDPLQMNDSTFMLPEEELETISPLYRFENGRPASVDRHIIPYKMGSEYASGGAGGISTADDYMKFLEGLRTYKLIAPETLELMKTPRIQAHQAGKYWHFARHGYGLGIRCSGGNKHHSDFGWDGAAGAYLAQETEKGISIFFACHLLSSPVQSLYPMLYRLIMSELFSNEPSADIFKELSEEYGYNLT